MIDRNILYKLVDEAIVDKVFPGCAIGLINKVDGKFQREYFSFGNYTYDEKSKQVDVNTIYDVASITKTVSTGFLMMKLLDEGKVNLEDKIRKYFPEFSGSEFKDLATIKHLLTYTLDFQNFTDEQKKNLMNNLSVEDFRNNIFNLQLATKPGTVYKYSDATADIQGRIIEKVTGKKLNELFLEVVAKPLNLNSSTLSPATPLNPNGSATPSEEGEFPAPTQVVDGQILRGLVNDPKARKSYKSGYFSGCAGLFSNATDLLKVVEMFLDKKISSLMIDNQLNLNVPTNMCTTDYSIIALNEMLGVTDFSGKNRYIGKSGFTGPLMFMDLEKEIGMAFLCNRTFPDGPVNVDRYTKFRRELVQLVFNN